MKRSFLSLTFLTLGLILSSNFSGLVKFSDDGVYAQDKSKFSQCSDFKDKQEYANAIQCFKEFIENSQNQKELSEELSSAYYRLADTYYLDGQYINSYNLSSDKAKARIEKDTDTYRKALYYLLRANNQLRLGEYANAKHTINDYFLKETFNTPDRKNNLITFYLSQGRIYTATAQINAANNTLSYQDNSVAMKAYENARREILEKLVGSPERIYCNPLVYDEKIYNETQTSEESTFKEGDFDLDENSKEKIKKATNEDLFKLLETIIYLSKIYLSKNRTYQDEFNRQYLVLEDKKGIQKVTQGSYVNDLECYIELISSADNSPVQNPNQDNRSKALFYNYLGEGYEELADKNINSKDNYSKAKDYYDKSSDTKYEYIKVLSLKNLANLYKKNGKNQDAISSYEKIAGSLEKTVNKIVNPSLIQKQFIEANKLNVYQNIIALLWEDSSKSEEIIQYIEESRINSEGNKKVKSDCSWLLNNNYKGEAGKIAIKEILNCLPENTTLIDYFVAKDDRVYAVVINKQNEGDKYTIELPTAKNKLGMEKELTSQIEQFYQYDLTAGVRACQQSDGKDEQLCQPQSLKKLYDILIKPIKDQIKTENLIIVPHRILHNLPFAALYDSQNKQYLTEKYAISILPSIYSLATISPEKNSVDDRNNIGVVALANPTFDLLNSQIEVETIKELKSRTNHGQPLYNLHNPLFGNPLYGKNATLENLKRNLNNEDTHILHLSTHSEVDHRNALNTRLVLNGYKNYLKATGINDLPKIGKLNLVVLSACETNVGEITKGDAVFNLTNSFLDNGVSSVVSSLWNVDDRATSDLMKNFYTELAAPGQSKAKALQNAQAQLLRDEKTGEYRHPYYWGAFLLTGDSSPLIKK